MLIYKCVDLTSIYSWVSQLMNYRAGPSPKRRRNWDQSVRRFRRDLNPIHPFGSRRYYFFSTSSSPPPLCLKLNLPSKTLIWKSISIFVSKLQQWCQRFQCKAHDLFSRSTSDSFSSLPCCTRKLNSWWLATSLLELGGSIPKFSNLLHFLSLAKLFEHLS